VKLDGVVVTNELHHLRLEALASVTISLGKKKHGLLRGSF
jgi:hypothetical protein